VWLFTGNRNAPTNRGARNAQVLQTAFDEADDFVLARFRLNEGGIFLVKIEQRLLERGKFEEVVLFRNGFRGPAAIGTVVARLGVVYEGVVVNAVLAGVVALVDVAVFLAQLEKPLHGADMFQVGGANELVGGQSKLIPQIAPLVGHSGDKFGFGDVGLFRGAFYVDAVFVGAGGHHHFVAAHALVAANHVGDHRGVGVADVRQAVCVVDRRG
jgi:hypothetical protein